MPSTKDVEKPPREPPKYIDDSLETEEKPKGKQHKCFSLLTYLPEDIMWLELQAHSKHIKRYAYAYHDKDIWVEDVFATDKDTGQILTNENGEPIVKHHKGEPKEPHFHLIVQLNQPRYPGAVANWFTEYNNENTFCQPCIGESLARTWKYLIHDSKKCREDGKYIYEPSIRHTNDEAYFNRFDMPFNGDCVLNALLDLEAGVSVRECALKYGRDFIIHFRRIKEVLDYMSADKE